jgi:hypothetical protein
MYGSSYMFRHYIAIFRERSYCLLRDAQIKEQSTEYRGWACCVLFAEFPEAFLHAREKQSSQNEV